MEARFQLAYHRAGEFLNWLYATAYAHRETDEPARTVDG